MNFDKLITDLDAQDETIKLCAAALRKRADWLDLRSEYDGCNLLLQTADWLESEQGRGMILDLSISRDLAK